MSQLPMSADRQPEPRPRSKRVAPHPPRAAGPLLGLLSLLLALLLGEGIGRASSGPVLARQQVAFDEWTDPELGRPSPGVLRPNAVLAFTHQPNASEWVRFVDHQDGGFRFRTNGYGLRRDAEVAIPKPPGVFRVLVLGDSQTDGYVGNDESYPQLVESTLRALSGQERVEVLNGGVLGYSPQQEYLWYREYGAALEPDLVILTLYAGNDLDDMLFPAVPTAVVDADAGRLRPWSAPTEWLTLNSRLYQLARRAAISGPLLEPLARLGWITPLPSPGLDRLERALTVCPGCWFQNLKQVFDVRGGPDRAAREAARLDRLIELMSQQLAARQVRLAVVVLPTKGQVEPNDDAAASRIAADELGIPEDALTVNDQFAAGVLAGAARAGVPAVDPRPLLARAAADERLYYRRDWHLNAAGHRRLAGLLVSELVARGLVPAPGPAAATVEPENVELLYRFPCRDEARRVGWWFDRPQLAPRGPAALGAIRRLVARLGSADAAACFAAAEAAVQTLGLDWGPDRPPPANASCEVDLALGGLYYDRVFDERLRTEGRGALDRAVAARQAGDEAGCLLASAEVRRVFLRAVGRA